jgi:hypothetical protein
MAAKPFFPWTSELISNKPCKTESSSLVRLPLTGFPTLAFYPPALFPETLRWAGTHC